ncbi:MAG: leucine-rich repeat protein [Bacteroidales bacterium]|nr:leucine-rich repeat protein [Bacteroidales bacterium]
MKRIMLLCFVLLAWLSQAQDYDFAKKIGGNTLYFYITSTGGKKGATVEVTYPGASEEEAWKGFAKPSGQLSIPEKVTPDRAKGRHADPEDDDTTIYTVTSINYFAFSGCDRITRLVIPSTVTQVGESAFAGCKRIEYIVVEAPQPPKMDESAFDKVDLDIPLRVPLGTYELYKSAVGWRLFTEILEY